MAEKGGSLDLRLGGGLLEVLGRSEVYAIHSASLEVLERVGVKVLAPRALEILKEGGARVDLHEKVAYLPSPLVEEMVHKAPSRFTLYSRDSGWDMRMEYGRVNYGAAGTLPSVIDPESGEKRPATLRDAEELARLMDALENVDEGYCLVYPQDVPDATAHVHMALATVRNIVKPSRARMYSAQVAEDCMRMAAIVAGGEEELRRKPNFWSNNNPVSPLTHSRALTEGMLKYAEWGIPVGISPQIQAGATGPVTLAGTLVQANAEVLSGIVILELANPGNPVFYGIVSSVMDPRGGGFAYGAVEAGLFTAAGTRLARFYDLPSRGAAGTTDSCVMDMQAGYEGALTSLIATLSGCNFILYPVGGVEQALTACYEKAVVDDEVLGMVRRAERGIEVNDETLAVEVICRVGFKGHYLGEEHTRRHLRREHFIPELASRRRWDSWREAGGKDVRERAKEKLKRILKEHTPKPLDKGVEKELEDYVKKVEKRVTRSQGNHRL